MDAGVTEVAGSFALMKCSHDHYEWKLGRDNIVESEWRLKVSSSWVTNRSHVSSLIPGHDRHIDRVADVFRSLPPPRTYRAGQHGMARAIAMGLRDRRVVLANAGVGIGKTYAYLLPALSWLNTHPMDTIVVATRTILLQHQLIGDIEEAQKILRTKIPVLLVKGQNQYLCMQKLQKSAVSLTPDLRILRDWWASEHEAEVKRQEESYRSRTKVIYHRGIDGRGGLDTVRVYTDAEAREMAERNVSGPEFDVDRIDAAGFSGVSEGMWDQIKVTPDTDCRSCSVRLSCGWAKLREKRTQFRGLLVSNHGLLAKDTYDRLNHSRGLWPAPRAVIVDEAHALEDALRSASANEITVGELRSLLSNIIRKLVASPLPHIQDFAQELEPAVQRLADALTHAMSESKKNGSKLDEEYDVRALALVPTKSLQRALSEWTGLVSALEDAMVLARADREQDRWEKLREPLEQLEQWSRIGDKSSYIVWVEGRKICIGALNLFPAVEVLTTASAILSSGTLGILDDFTLIEFALGLNYLDPARIWRFYAPSPFDYQRQLRYQLAKNLPDPRKPEEFSQRASAVAHAIRRLHATHPRILVLFTSKRLLRTVKDRLKPTIPELIYDGQASPAELAEKFRGADNAVYLSTAAWEGLDVPGPKAVVIVQLPYPVPTDPWVQAKVLNARAADATVREIVTRPIMQIRMIQGVGRAIRRHDDTGIVVILDPRVVRRFKTDLAPILPHAPIEVIEF